MFDWMDVLCFILIVVVVCFTIWCIYQLFDSFAAQLNQEALLTDDYMEKVGIDDDTGFVFYCDTKTGYMYIRYKSTFEQMLHEDGKPILFSEWLTMGGSTDGKE